MCLSTFFPLDPQSPAIKDSQLLPPCLLSRGNKYCPRDHVRPEAVLERKDRTLGGLSFEINSRSPSPNIHRPAKRRRTSVINVIGSSSDIDNQTDPESDTIIVEVPQLHPTPESKPAPQPGNNNITTRPRRQAALKSRYATIAQAKSVDRPNLQRSNRLTINQKTANGIQAKLENDGKGKGKGKEKERPSTKTKNLNKDNGQDRGKKESTKNTDEDEDDNYECPCGYGCSTISFCESRKKEITTRDVGMSVIISCKTSVTVLVGTPSHQENFVVHKDLLALHSDYFASLFRQTQDVTPPSSTSIIQAKSASFDRNELSLDAPLPPPFFGAMKGNNLVMGIESTGSVARVKVKQAEDSDEDIEIISSDQYYTTLPSKSNSLKLKLTPIKHRSILPGKANMSHPTLFSFASKACNALEVLLLTSGIARVPISRDSSSL
ncbi:uncharacterized protein RAG0_05644 [Rhynchosporium agropyri]|uniref:BTB domain-containing protein n=1 Tax=Rhynchosporium agropyri TaxID=914238 RepID=A0A1E1KDX3_9HELO|nr:uncharacterized protein RAG0_05644 [Rhynchosporium agropyri]